MASKNRIVMVDMIVADASTLDSVIKVTHNETNRKGGLVHSLSSVDTCNQFFMKAAYTK